MARGRMLSKSLSTSAKVAALYKACPKLAEWCRVLYPLLLAHADDWGRLQGDELTVKLQVDPISPRKLPDFVAALHCLHQVGLITWYQVEDRKVIEIVSFSAHQDLKGHTSNRQSKLPACPGPEYLIGKNRRDEETRIKTHLGEVSPQTSLKRTEENRTEPKGTEPNQSGGRFDLFWDAYPKKVGKDAARKAFERRAVSDDLLTLMLGAIAAQKTTRGWLKDGGQFIPNPATWLNGGRWEDEILVEGGMSDNTAMLVNATKGFLES